MRLKQNHEDANKVVAHEFAVQSKEVKTTLAKISCQ